MTNIIDFWFPNDRFNKFWFNKSKDTFIIETYGCLLNNSEEVDLQPENLTDIEILEHIIVLDQFSRSIYRNEQDKIKINDIKSLKLSLYYLENRNWKNIEFNHLIFYLMPLRHTFQKKYYDKILEILNLFQKKDKDTIFYDKFYNATISRYNKLT